MPARQDASSVTQTRMSWPSRRSQKYSKFFQKHRNLRNIFASRFEKPVAPHDRPLTRFRKNLSIVGPASTSSLVRQFVHIGGMSAQLLLPQPEYMNAAKLLFRAREHSDGLCGVECSRLCTSTKDQRRVMLSRAPARK
jgi:hypothetical protein